MRARRHAPKADEPMIPTHEANAADSIWTFQIGSLVSDSCTDANDGRCCTVIRSPRRLGRAGRSDPGAAESMQKTACTRMVGFHLVDGAGHWVQQEQPGKVTELLTKFLQDQSPHDGHKR